MSYVMCATIHFPAHRGRRAIDLHRVGSVKIEKSWKMLTDTAEITLPRKVADFRRQRLDELFREGDPVEIRLGYNGNLYTEFTGYLSKTATGIPVRLWCEDEMHVLKRRTVSVSLSHADLKTLLRTIAPGYAIDCYDGVTLGNVRYAGVTAAQVLEDIARTTGMKSYFDGKILRCGKVYADQAGVPAVVVHLERNAVSEEINRRNNGEAKIQVKAISLLKGGKKIEVKVGDAGGAIKQLTYTGITVKAELEKRAREDYGRMKRKGFEGKIELFGLPRVVHGQKIDLRSDLCPELAGTYYVEKVTKVFGDNATYRQQIEIGDECK